MGGGIIGLCSAFALERHGWEVMVLDASTPGAGASSVNAGWIVPSLSAPVPAPGLVRTSLRWMLRPDSPLYIRPRADVDLVRWLVAFWRHCNQRDHLTGLEATAELNRRTMALYDELAGAGVTFERHHTGVLFAYCSPAELEHDLRALEPLKGFGLDLPEPLGGTAVRALEPALTDALAGGFWLPGERHVRPDSLSLGLVEHLTGRNVEIRWNSAVTGFECDGSRVRAVRIGNDRIEADAVVISAGAWSARVARMAGVRLPIQGGKGYSLDYAPPPRPVNHALYLHELRVAVTPLDGMVRLAGTMEFSGLNNTIRPDRVAAIARAGVTALRDWPTDPTVPRIGSGLRPMTPDGLPVIGWLPGFRNLAVASGHAMLGVTLAPATGAAIAELLANGDTPEAIRAFNPARFAA
ncbi:MAG: FAD-dependent oxidoreductase [Chloroflexota bacterium]|nr:FAD-dependent oxidoreductase [Chloroflexota bacterium]